MRKKSRIVIFLFLLPLLNISAQIPGFYMEKGAKRIEIPFEQQDNFIILKVLFQGFFPLRFILDTGAEHTILTKKEVTNLLRISYEREMTIMGTDMKTQIKAYIARKMRLELTNLTLVKDILVLDEDYFKFDQFLGMDIHGILGAETFKGYVLKVDYNRHVLTVYDPSVFRPSDHRKYEELPIEIFRSKPYIRTSAQINSDTVVSLKLLLDTGAALALLLHTYSTPDLIMPPKVLKGTLGTGLGGQIEGYLGRIKSLKLGTSKLNYPVSNFQELINVADSNYLNGRNGLIGNETLSRFNFIVDFSGEKLYLQRNFNYKETFEFDKSGMTIIAGGTSLNEYTVYDVFPNSPAFEAGILRGDEIVKIKWLPTSFYTLPSINSYLEGKVGKKIKLTIKRNGKKIKVQFILRELL